MHNLKRYHQAGMWVVAAALLRSPASLALPLFPLVLQDPACMSYSQALLHFKGFHAIEVRYRTVRTSYAWCAAAKSCLAKLQHWWAPLQEVHMRPATCPHYDTAQLHILLL